MVYTPKDQSFSLDVRNLRTDKGKVQASWYNPIDGSYQFFNWSQPSSGDGVAKFTPPFVSNETIYESTLMNTTPEDCCNPNMTIHGDWVLVLEAKSTCRK